MFLAAAVTALVSANAPESLARAEDDEDAFTGEIQTTAERDADFEKGLKAYDSGDFAAAFEIWLPLAQSRNLTAQRNVAHLLRRGLGVERDPQRAADFLERAARYGLPGAMADLAQVYSIGDGRPRDIEKAAFWMGEAARRGHAGAQYEFAQLLEAGLGVAPNPERAAEFLARSAAAGYPPAVAQLESRSGN